MMGVDGCGMRRLEPTRALRVYDLLAACGWIATAPPPQQQQGAPVQPGAHADRPGGLKGGPGSQLRLTLPGAEHAVKEELPTATSSAAGVPFPGFRT